MENTNNERILLESKNNYIGKLKKIIIISLIVAVVFFIIARICNNNASKNWEIARNISNRTSFSYLRTDKEDYKEYEKYMSKSDTFYTMVTITGIISIAGATVFIPSLLIILYSRNMRIVVTDKRVYGQASFGRQVDLPLDSISAIGKWFLKGIVVATSSGKIRFMLISNRDNIYKTISDLLIDRQNKKKEQTTIVNNAGSNADELKKYKELLDTGVITQEEFEAKKKQLLNL